MNNKILIILIGTLLVLGISIYLFSNLSSNIKLINADEVEDLLKNERVFVLQAHEPYQGELDKTDLIIEDWENIYKYKNLLPNNKKDPLLVYCRSGRMSAIVAQQLSDLGYKDIYDLDGGMKAWETSGKKLIFN